MARAPTAAQRRGDHLRCPHGKPDGRAGRRRRHGRLQHLLRDPVLRQARADRAAHQAAHGAVHPRLSAPRTWAWCACCATTACATPAPWPTALRNAAAAARPSEVVVPGLLDGLDNVNQAGPPWLRRRRTEAPARSRPRRTGRRCARRARFRNATSRHAMADRSPRAMDSAIAVVLKGYPRLSETFIAQEILAWSAAGLEMRLYLAAPPDRPRVHPVHREIARRSPTCRSTCRTSRCGCSRGLAAARRRLPGYARGAARRLAGATCAATRRATGCGASARPACWPPSCRPTSAGCTRTSCTRRPRSSTRYRA